MTCKIYFIVIFALVTCNFINAQYIGGINDGSTRSSLNGSRLSGEIASFTVLYQGSSGDGFDALSNQVLLLDSNFRIYDGSSGDGFSKNNSLVTLNGNIINNLYGGNIGDGHSQGTFQSLIGGEDLTMLFSGNSGDGADFEKLSSVFLEGFILAIFEGGNGDGFTSLLKPNNYLSGLMLMLYHGGNGDGFATYSLKTALTLDLVEQLVKLNILLYPNPASDIVHIEPNEGITITSIALYDISGKMMNVDLSNENTLSVKNLSDGIYLLNIFSQNGTVTKKLIVKK